MLNYIWIAFVIVSFVVASIKLVVLGDTDIYKKMVDGLFDTTKISVMDIALPLVGMMTFWLGIMRVGEKAGAIRFLSRIVAPFFTKLFPGVPKNHPAIGNMMMNFSANLLGLDNAATPLGLKAMESLQTLNSEKETANDSQIMFLVLHTSGLTLIPTSIMLYRYLNGASDPTDIFIPCIIATFFTTLFGIIIVGIKQKLQLLSPMVFGTLLGVFMFLIGLSYVIKTDSVNRANESHSYISQHFPKEISPEKSLAKADFVKLFPTDYQKQVLIEGDDVDQAKMEKATQEFVNHQRSTASRIMSNFLLLMIPVGFIGGALYKKVNVFDEFIEGAKEGFEIAVKIIPYLVAMLAAISLLRNSGVVDYLLNGIAYLIGLLGISTEFIPALPTALMKPLSGSGSRALMIETMQTYGADSLVGRMASVFQGSADTTFYIIALYFGSVGIKKTRYAISAGLLTELLGVIAAIFITYYFFG